MSDTALDIVHQAVQSLQGRGASAHASAASLAQLAKTAGAKPAVQKPAPAPIPVAQPPRAVAAPTVPQSLPPVPTKHSSPAATGSKSARLEAIRGPILACMKCPNLVKSRTQVVFGVGNPDAEIMFVGEAPGADEDMVGEPFVGKAGQLLTKIIETMGLRRSDVFIANVL